MSYEKNDQNLEEIREEEWQEKKEKAVERENKMGVLPVNKLLITMSLPMMASMLVQALYNIVDSIFVSRVAEDALTAVSMAFPLQMLMIALAGGTGVGINAILSRALGEKEFDKANKTAVNGIFSVRRLRLPRNFYKAAFFQVGGCLVKELFVIKIFICPGKG